MRQKRPLIQDLLAPKLLHAFAEERYDHSEAIARISMAPLNLQAKMRGELDVMETTAILLRTSTLFVVDHDEVQEVISSSGESPLEELPPLPFPRVAFECSEDVGWQVYLSPGMSREQALETISERVRSGEDPGYIIDLVLVNEIQQGREWFVVYLVRIPDEEVPNGDIRRAILIRVTPGGKVEIAKEKPYKAGDNPLAAIEWEDPPFGAQLSLLRRVPVELAHLINARGVSLVDIVARADRRRASRRGFVFPSVYWVDIRSAHEVTRGQSDREYHCRWMVRGHWRHLDDERRTWVRPYIKGPVGAPWKGRPVYMVSAA